MNVEEEINLLKNTLIKRDDIIIDLRTEVSAHNLFFQDISNRLAKLEQRSKIIEEKIQEIEDCIKDNDTETASDDGSGISPDDLKKSVTSNPMVSQKVPVMEITYIS